MAQPLREGPWSPQKSAALYLVEHWGQPYFRVNERGHMAYAPAGEAGPQIDLKALLDELIARGVHAPVLLRFNDILGQRIEHIDHAFRGAIKRLGYSGAYCGVMPIKVNQQRHVVEELVQQGERYGLGLEAGSKPELLVAMALLADRAAPIVCNGYKDREYIETALHAQHLGLRPIIVLDRYAELELVVQCARQTGLVPRLGLRAKLEARGSGRWRDSSGSRSKFGLSARELVQATERLRAEGLLDALHLLHFHIGSQITSIRSVKEAVREAGHLYVGLRELGAHGLDAIDCGGGLAIDYDGSRTDFHASKNYSTQEYADDIVGGLRDICDARQMPHPRILTESGRALVAQHSVLVFNVLGVHRFCDGEPLAPTSPKSGHDIVARLQRTFASISQRNVQTAFNDLIELKEESALLFNHGVIDLKTRAQAEQWIWAGCERVRQICGENAYVPDDLRGIEKELSDTYYCNFSVFQSLPDAWAVGHMFPIVPLHKLDKEPTREAVLADLTCDSDGKIDRFIDLRDVRHTLRLHAPDDEPYYLGAFFVGAYQETLGDLHNLFGDTHAVHVRLHADGRTEIEHVVKGDTVAEVLGYVEYDADALRTQVLQAAQKRVHQKLATPSDVQALLHCFDEGMAGYTYLEDSEPTRAPL